MFMVLGQLLANALSLAAFLRQLNRDLVRINESIFRASVVAHPLRLLKNQAVICREWLATHGTSAKRFCLFGLHTGSLERFHLSRQPRPRGRPEFGFSR